VLSHRRKPRKQQAKQPSLGYSIKQSARQDCPRHLPVRREERILFHKRKRGGKNQEASCFRSNAKDNRRRNRNKRTSYLKYRYWKTEKSKGMSNKTIYLTTEQRKQLCPGKYKRLMLWYCKDCKALHRWRGGVLKCPEGNHEGQEEKGC